MSAETSSGVGYPRWTPPIPPVAKKRMPTSLATVRTPPTVVAPTSPATAHAARSRGPTFRASLVKRSSSARVSPTRISAVEDADRRGDRARVPDRSVAGEPDLEAVRRGEAVRDDGRLERDDRPRAPRSPPAPPPRGRRAPSCVSLHLDEREDTAVRLVLERARHEKSGALVHADRPGIERGDAQPETTRPIALARICEAAFQVARPEAAAGEVRPKPEPEDDEVGFSAGS